MRLLGPHFIAAVACIVATAVIIPATVNTINSNAVRVRSSLPSTHVKTGDDVSVPPGVVARRFFAEDRH